MKKLFLLSIMFVSELSFSQGVVYKCVDSEGMITYQNSSENKDLKCDKTSLGNVENLSIYKPISSIEKKESPKDNKEISSTKSLNAENPSVDEGRKKILTKELSGEKDELVTVISMLDNLKKSLGDKIDEKVSQQIKMLQDLKLTHENNISSLEKELGLNKSAPNNLKITKPN
jgi:hypothetical protein